MALKEDWIDFSKICRLCLMEESVMFSIYNETDKHSNSVPLPLRIMACASIELNSIDCLPSQICSTCLCQVDGWYKFKHLCETTDALLKECIKNKAVHEEAIIEIRSRAKEVRQFFASSHLVRVEGLDSTLNESSENLLKNVENGNEDKFKVYSLFKIRSGKSKSIKDKKGCEDEDFDSLKGENGQPSDDDSLDDETLANRIKSVSESENSSDDDMTLSARKRKMLQEKNKRSKTRKKMRKSNEVRRLRTVKMQTGDDEEDYLEVVETKTDKMPEKKKTKSRKTQTVEEQGGTKKRFRIRPAIPSSCTLCDKVYKNSEILRQHMKSHHVTGTIECPSCKLTFTSVRSLKYHEQRKHSNLEPVPCTFCGKKFLDKKYLRVHENIHSQANHFVCQFCGRKFIMKTNLTVHISRHHTKKSNDFICQVCGKAFPFKLYLKKHFKTHTDDKPYQCTYCEAKFRENTLLRKHINSIHLKLRPFLCQYCQKSFTRSLYLKDHMESQHLGIQRKVECSKCGESFQNRNRLRQHECLGRMEIIRIEVNKQKSVEKKKPPEKEATTIYNSEPNIRNPDDVWWATESKNTEEPEEDKVEEPEEDKVEEPEKDKMEEPEKDKVEEPEKDKVEKPPKKRKRRVNYVDVTYDYPVPTKDGKVFQCRLCLKYLTNVTNRNRHEIEKHPGPIPCDFCQKSFTTVVTYHIHRNVHLGLTKFQCKYCGKYFASRSNLDDHEKVHTQERPVDCPQCDKSFSSISNLKVHLRFHSGARTKCCNICGKGFVTAGNLRHHLRRHTNERSHVCDMCGKGFTGKGELRKHIVTHSTEKKYSCHFCLQKLKTPNSLRRHVNIQHLKIRPFKCELCLRDFGRKESLREHMQVHAPKKKFFCTVCKKQYTCFNLFRRHKCK